MKVVLRFLLLLSLVLVSFRPAVQAQSVSQLVSRAVDHYYAGECQQALNLLTQAVRIAPGNATVHLWIGVVYADCGLDKDRAVASLKRAKELARPDSPDATAAQRWLLRLQGHPPSVILHFFARDPRYDRIVEIIVEGMTRRMAAEGTYKYEVVRGTAAVGGGVESLLVLAKRREAGWVLRGVLRNVSIGPALFERGKYYASLSPFDISLIDGILGTVVAEFDGAQGYTDVYQSRALDGAVARTASAIWPKVLEHIKSADARARDELKRLSIRLPVEGVYAYTCRVDRQVANALPRVVVPALRSSAGAGRDARDDATDLLTRKVIDTCHFAVVPEPELFKHLKTRGDGVDEQTLLRAAATLRVKHLVLGDITALQSQCKFAIIGTQCEANATVRIRLLSAQGEVLGETAVSKRKQKAILLQTDRQARDQEKVVRSEVLTEIAAELATRIDLLASGRPLPTPGPATPAPTPVPAPVPTEGSRR